MVLFSSFLFIFSRTSSHPSVGSQFYSFSWNTPQYSPCGKRHKFPLTSHFWPRKSHVLEFLLFAKCLHSLTIHSFSIHSLQGWYHWWANLIFTPSFSLDRCVHRYLCHIPCKKLMLSGMFSRWSDFCIWRLHTCFLLV